jgi:hypothetical protein
MTNKLIIDDIIYGKKRELIDSITPFLIGDVNTRKTSTLMCIIKNMLRYYTKDLPNVALTKPKIMKLVNIGKVAFNNNCITIHSTLKILNHEKSDTLINAYDQL